jgi:hypothetical protein
VAGLEADLSKCNNKKHSVFQRTLSVSIRLYKMKIPQNTARSFDFLSAAVLNNFEKYCNIFA